MSSGTHQSLCRRIRDLFMSHIVRLQYSASRILSPKRGLDPYISRVSLVAAGVLGVSLVVIAILASAFLIASIAQHSLDTTLGPYPPWGLEEGRPYGEIETEMIHTLHIVGVIFELTLGIIVFILEVERVPHIAFDTLAKAPNTFWLRYAIVSSHKRARKHLPAGMQCLQGDRLCANLRVFTHITNSLLLSPRYRTLADFFVYSSLAMLLYVLFMIYNTIHTVLASPPLLLLAALATALPLGPAVARTLTTPAKLLYSELEYYRLSNLTPHGRKAASYNLAATIVALAALLPFYYLILTNTTSETLLLAFLVSLLAVGPYLVAFVTLSWTPLNYISIYIHSIIFAAYTAYNYFVSPRNLVLADYLMELAMLLLLDSIMLLYYRATKLYADKPQRGPGGWGASSLYEYYRDYLEEIHGLLKREGPGAASKLILEDMAILLHYHVFFENCIAHSISGISKRESYISNSMLHDILESITVYIDSEKLDNTLILILNRILFIAKVRLQPLRYKLTIADTQTSPDSTLAETAIKAYRLSEKILKNANTPPGEPLRSLKNLHSEITGSIRLIRKLTQI